MLMINLLVVLMFVCLGILFAMGKGVNLIAGYNTMPREKRDAYDEKRLCACMARMMFLLAGAWSVFGVGVQLEKNWLVWTGMAFFLGVIGFFLIYMNTGNHLKK